MHCDLLQCSQVSQHEEQSLRKWDFHLRCNLQFLLTFASGHRMRINSRRASDFMLQSAQSIQILG